jgi:hypothetical protein
VIIEDRTLDKEEAASREHDKFTVVLARDKFVVVESEAGFIFDGKLSHAGVPVYYPGYIQAAVLDQVQIVVQNQYDEGKKHDPEFFERIFSALCNVENLDKITRFHALIMPKDDEIQHLPNSVYIDDQL